MSQIRWEVVGRLGWQTGTEVIGKQSPHNKIAQKSTSAPKARPRAPKSRREAQKDPPRRPEFEALQGPQAHEKAIRKYWSKGLSKPLYARSTNDPWLSGRYWGRSLASPGLLWLLLAVPGLAGIPWPLSSCLSGLRCPSPLASPGLPWPPLVAARGLP